MGDPSYITVGEFAHLLGPEDVTKLLAGENTGRTLDRGTAAKLVRRLLKTEHGEEDEDVSGWKAAAVLKDLYECRVCVADIVNVYLKGIIGSRRAKSGEEIFAARECVTHDEAKEIVLKVSDRSLRTPAIISDGTTAQTKVIDIETALSMLSKNKRAVLIDLRMPGDYEADHINGAVNIPLNDFVKNPYRAAKDTGAPVVFFCENGYKSALAANLATECGYTDCYVTE